MVNWQKVARTHLLGVCVSVCVNRAKVCLVAEKKTYMECSLAFPPMSSTKRTKHTKRYFRTAIVSNSKQNLQEGAETEREREKEKGRMREEEEEEEEESKKL